MSEQPRWIFVACEFCQGEGRILKQGHNVWEEIDDGPCPECHGKCVVEVQAELITAAECAANG